MRVAFIPALPPSALMGGMIAPSSRLVNRFSRKKREKHSGEGAERQRFERPFWRKKRASPRRPARYPRATRTHQPSEVWRAAALQSEIRIPGAFPQSSIGRRHPADMRGVRKPCWRKASLRRFPPGSPPKEGEKEAAPPVGKDRRQPSFSDALIAVCRSSRHSPR